MTTNRDPVLEELERILASRAFRGAERASALLRYLVEQELEGKGERLKEYTVGTEGLGRADTFDPRTDPIVRAEASRLRGRLERYYESEGASDPTIIVLHKGTYVPVFHPRDDASRSSAAVASDLKPNATAEGASSQWSTPRIVAMALIAAVALAVGLWIGRGHTTTAAVVSSKARFDVALTSSTALGSEVGTDVVISRDGTRLAFISTDRSGVPRLSTRALENANAVELPGTEGARGPFFSPDGRWIGFWVARKLEKVAVDGGAPVVLCEAADLLGATWGEDDSIIANLGGDNALWRIPAGGGKPTRIGDFSPQSASPRWPHLLPGGTDVLYTAVSSIAADRATIEVLSLRTGKRKTVVTGGTFGRYLASGDLAYVNQGALYVTGFDLSTMSTRGRATPVLDSIAYSPTFGYAQIDFSNTGIVVYRRSAGPSTPVWLDSSGVVESLVDVAGPYISPKLSPDSRHFAVSTVDGGIFTTNFFEWDQLRHRAARMPESMLQDGFSPLWTPDGRFVVAGGVAGISWMRPGRAPQLLLQSQGYQLPWSFTPNGDRLAYHEVNLKRSSAFDIWTVAIHADERGLHAGSPEVFLQTDSYEVYPAFSPDGQWLAYSSNESGTWEVYVRHFPDNGRKVQVSRDGGRVPRWSRTRQDLFYATDNQRLMVAHYDPRGGSFTAETPRQWSTLRLADTGVLPNYDLASDGRVLALIPKSVVGQSEREHHAMVVMGFFDELRRRATAGGR